MESRFARRLAAPNPSPDPLVRIGAQIEAQVRAAIPVTSAGDRSTPERMAGMISRKGTAHRRELLHLRIT